LFFRRGATVAIALLKRDRLEIVDINETVIDGGTLRFNDAVGLQKIGDDNIAVLDADGIHLISLSDVPAKINLAGEKLPATAPPIVDAQVACVGVDLCGSTLVARYSNGETIVYDAEQLDGNGEPNRKSQLSGILAETISPDGKWLAATKGDSIAVFDLLAEGRQTATLPIDSTGSHAFAWKRRDLAAGGGAASFELLCVAAKTTEGAVRLTWNVVDPATGAATDADKSWLLPEDIVDDRMVGDVKVRSLELSPQTNEYVAVTLASTQTSDSGLKAESTVLKICRKGAAGWLEAVDQKLNGRNVIRASFSEIVVDDAADTVASRLALLTEDQGILTPMLFLLARHSPSEDRGGQAESTNSPVEFRFEEIQNLLSELRQNDLIDIAFSGDGRTLLAVGQRATRALLSDVPSDPVDAD
jgi:hypothetical protein